MAGPQHGTRARGHTDRAAPRSALWPPIFDELADPVAVALDEVCGVLRDGPAAP
jgi:hypothetical protein